jgi:3-hydroxyacyl-CoA dehydrogenase
MHETRSTIAVQTLSVQPRIVATVAIIGAGTMGTGMALGQTLKKIPVLTGNAFGFIGNCIYNAYRQQCRTTAVNRLHATGDRSRYARCVLALARA